jgi:hypothetical protein
MYHLLVFVLWLTAMSWLVVEKVLPPVLGGSPPDYDSVLTDATPEPVCWRIRWNDETLGSVASQVVEHPDGISEMRSVVRFDSLPLESMLSELLGVLAKVAQPLMGGAEDYRITAVLATQLWFDDERRLQGFHTILDLGDVEGFVTIRGRVTSDQKLDVVASLSEGLVPAEQQGGWEMLHQQIELPPNALVGDSFAPRAELKDLYVGQSWTIPVYRPFPPNSPVQIVEAEVERHDVILWEGEDIETMVIVYRTDAGSGIRASRDPVGTEWVRRDGMVLRQEIAFASLRLSFERTEDDPLDTPRELLDEEKHPRLWSTIDSAP